MHKCSVLNCSVFIVYWPRSKTFVRFQMLSTYKKTTKFNASHFNRFRTNKLNVKCIFRKSPCLRCQKAFSFSSVVLKRNNNEKDAQFLCDANSVSYAMEILQLSSLSSMSCALCTVQCALRMVWLLRISRTWNLLWQIKWMSTITFRKLDYMNRSNFRYT